MKSFIEKLDYLRRLFVMSFLSLVIGFVPFYANAFVPLVGIAASQGGRLLVQGAAGMAVKKLTKTGIVKAAKSNIARCLKNPAACVGVGGLISAGLGAADLEVNVTNNDTDNYSIDIFLESDKNSNYCYDVKYNDSKYGTSDQWYNSLSQLVASVETSSRYAPNYKVDVDMNSYNSALTAVKNTASTADGYNEDYVGLLADEVFVYDWQRVGTSFSGTKNFYVGAFKKTCGSSTGNSDSVNNNYVINKEYVDNTIYNYVTNHPQSPDIIKEIHNNYGGDHVVNNENIAGDTINNYYDNSVNYEVTNELADDITGGKVDLDKVDDTNCHRNSAGKFDWCEGSDGDKPDDDNDPTDPKDPVEPDPATCDNNSFNRKVCDFINWVQNDGGVSDRPAEPVEVVDKTSDITDLINRQMVVFPRVCPSALSIPISVMGVTNNVDIDVTPVCNVFDMVRPFVIGVSTISMVYIIMGVRRDG